MAAKKMKRKKRGLTVHAMWLVLALSCSSLCMGTLETRDGKYAGHMSANLNEHPDRFGEWPYEAVWVDVLWGDTIIHHDGGGVLAFGEAILAPLFWLSIPLDFAIDTILLPADLVAWCFGYEKKRYHYRWDLDSNGRWKN